MRIVKDFKSNDSLSANPKRVTGAFLVSADCKGLRCVDAVEPLALKLFHLAQSSWQALHHIIPRWSRKPRGRNPTGSVGPSGAVVVEIGFGVEFACRVAERVCERARERSIANGSSMFCVCE